jgi:hypothetical protein
VGIDVLETTTPILNSLSSPRSLWVLLNRSKCNAFTELITGDDVMDGSDSYGWRNVVNRDLFNNTDSLKNAENYAYFGLCAKLADHNWRLPDDINEARKGRLVYDEDIPHK